MVRSRRLQLEYLMNDDKQLSDKSSDKQMPEIGRERSQALLAAWVHCKTYSLLSGM